MKNPKVSDNSFQGGWNSFISFQEVAIAWAGRVERERRGGFRMTAVLQVWVCILYALPICLQHFCKKLGVKFHLPLWDISCVAI